MEWTESTTAEAVAERFCGSKEVCGPNRVFFFAGKN